jgi:short-subunit dehydrogenase
MLTLITGASSGLGRELTRHYLRKGQVVVAVARNPARLAELAACPEAGSATLHLRSADVTDRHAMAELVEAVERDLGPLELAIASAGIALEDSTEKIELDCLERMLAVNLMGVAYTLAPVTSAMRRRGRGQVAALSSLAGLASLPRLESYCATKAALDCLMASFRYRLRPHGVTVTTVCPGFVATPLTAGRIPAAWCMPPERAAARIARAIARGRRVDRFPLLPHLALRLVGIAPERLREAAARRFTSRLAALRPVAPGGEGAERAV